MGYNCNKYLNIFLYFLEITVTEQQLFLKFHINVYFNK